MKKSLDLFVLICSLLLTFAAWRVTAQSVASQKERQSRTKSEAIALYIDQQMKQYTNVLEGTRGLFAASNSVERQEFQDYFKGQNITDNYPGVYTFSYISRVADSEINSFLTQLKADLSRDSLSLYPYLEPGDEHYIMSYISFDRESTARLYGFDLKTDLPRRTALESARDTGEATYIGPITIKGPEKEGFIITIPIYKNGMSTDTVGERQKALQGFVNETFLYDDFFNHVFSSVDHTGITIRIKDKDRLIYDSEKGAEPEADERTKNLNTTFSTATTIEREEWQLEFIANSVGQPVSVEEYFPNVVLMVGILVSILLFGTVFALSSSQVRANDIAEKMTQELRDKNEFIGEVLDHLPIGIAVNRTDNGQAMYMNHSFEAVYGWDRKHLTSVEDFFNAVYPDPVYRAKMKRLTLDAIATQDPTKMHWDNVMITTQTGLTRFVSARNIPLPKQKLMVSTVVDTTERSLAEKEIYAKKEELEQTNKLMIGRELKMVELKNEVERLKEAVMKSRKPL